MRNGVVFFNLKKNKKISKQLKKLKIQNKKNIIGDLIKNNKMITTSIFIVLLVVTVYSVDNLAEKNVYDELLEENKLEYRGEVSKNGLKEYKIDLNNINVYNTNTYQKITLGDIKITNYSSSRNLDFNHILKSKIELDKNKDKILIYHTHASESYSNSDKYKFEYSGTYRSKDEKYNMLHIGEVLGDNLNKYQIKYTQDRTTHDYSSYLNSYIRSAQTIKSNVQKEKYRLIMDVHRDAFGDLTKGVRVNLNGKTYAQLMFVVGMGTSGYYNPYALENLSFVLNLMALANTNYPGLFRPMLLRSSKYNQDLNKYAILLECGTTGNKIEEVENSMEIFAKLLNEFYKK